uniref:Uncharacterized protein n=1 Tax=Cacopsylla melanoneura TaxID=428564 RepID=A0A8D8V0C4_9HEMI
MIPLLSLLLITPKRWINIILDLSNISSIPRAILPLKDCLEGLLTTRFKAPRAILPLKDCLEGLPTPSSNIPRAILKDCLEGHLTTNSNIPRANLPLKDCPNPPLLISPGQTVPCVKRHPLLLF